MTQNTNRRILRLKQLVQLVGLSRSTVYRLIANGLFPRPLKIGMSAVGWDTGDIELWLAERRLAACR